MVDALKEGQQAGNQVGEAFWQKVLEEHNLDNEGVSRVAKEDPGRALIA